MVSSDAMAADPDAPGISARSDPSRRVALAVLLAILMPLIVARLWVGPGKGPWGLDASNYFQIARNFAEGRGLVTGVSLYFFGLDPLPQASSMIYPVWPVVLGLSGRYFGMLETVNVLPRLLYVLDLILVYALSNLVARRLWGTEFLLGDRVPIALGHLMAGLLGTTAIFFTATTHPYTEGLAFALAFGSLCLLDRVARSDRWYWPVLSGLAAGLAFLTRTQMAVLGLAILAVFAAIAWARRQKRLAFLLFLGSYAICLAGWYFLIFNTRELTRVPIPFFDMWVETSTVAGFVTERLLGLAVSFAAASSMSYVNLFGPATYLFPIAIIVFLIRMRRNPRDLPSLEVDHLLPLSVLVAGLFFFFSLNLFHERFFIPWLFGWRHGLPYLLLIIWGTGYLLAHSPSAVRYVVVGVVVVSVGIGATRVVGFASEPEPDGLTASEQGAIEWIDANHRGIPTILTTHAQTLAVFSRANFHWTVCEASVEQTRRMLELLPIDYVLVYEWESGCSFQSRSALRDILRLAAHFGREGDRIFVLAPTPTLLRERARLRRPSVRAPMVRPSDLFAASP